jgi:hypothetical protein
VRPVAIELADEVVEAGLLLQAVDAGWPASTLSRRAPGSTSWPQ